MASSIIGQLRIILGLDTAAFEKGLDESQKKLLKAGKSYEQIGRRIEGVGRTLSIGLTLPLVAIGGSALKMAADFETAMNRVQAATGASGADLKALRDSAKAFGQDKRLSATATDAATAMENLAKNGRSTQEILGGATEATLKLSAATGGDFAKSADLATDIMSQFGKKAEDLPTLVDKMSGAMIASKLDFDNYALAIGQAGAVAGNVMPFEDFNAALAATASSFASGSDAGTSFKVFLQRLVPQSKEAAETMKALGLDFFDTQGRFVGIGKVSDQLRTKLGGLAQEAQNKALSTIFGSDAMRTGVALMKQGSEGIARMRGEIDRIKASDQAAALMQGWSGAIVQVKKAFIDAAIAIGDSGFLSAITKVLVGVANAISTFARLPQPVLVAAGVFVGLAASIGPVLVVTGKLIGFWGTMLQLGPRLAIALGVVASGEAAAGVAGATGAIGIRAFGLALKSLGPYALALAGIAAAIWRVTAALKALSKASPAATANLKSSGTDALKARAAQLRGEIADYERGYRVVTRRARGAGAVSVRENLTGGAGRGAALARAGALSSRRAELASIDAEIASRAKAKPGPAKPAASQPTPAGANPDLDFSAERRKAFQESPEERRAQMRLDAEIAAAQERNDIATATRLQDQLRLRQQITDYQQTGLTREEATNAAQHDMLTVLAARREGYARELEDHKRALDIDSAQQRGDHAREQSLRDQAQLRDDILSYQQRGLALEEATSRALADQAATEATRAEVRRQWLEDDALARKIDQARSRGDTDTSIRALEQQQWIRERARQIEEAQGLDRGQGIGKATAESLENEQARLTGVWRATIKDGARAALDGDLKDWVKNWWRDRLSKGMEDALNSLSDWLMKIFGQLKGGGGGGGLLGSIGTALGKVFGGGAALPGAADLDFSGALAATRVSVPGFATGGSFRVGGSAGIDRNLVQFRATKGEIVDIRKPGNDNGGMVTIAVVPGQYFDARVIETAAPLADDAAMRGAVGGDRMAAQRTARSTRQKLR